MVMSDNLNLIQCCVAAGRKLAAIGPIYRLVASHEQPNLNAPAAARLALERKRVKLAHVAGLGADHVQRHQGAPLAGSAARAG